MLFPRYATGAARWSEKSERSLNLTALVIEPLNDFLMSSAEVSKAMPGNGASAGPPSLSRDAAGRIDLDSVPDVIQWFLDFDQRVAIIKHRNVEEVFQWKQQQSHAAGEEIFAFNRAEDRSEERRVGKECRL